MTPSATDRLLAHIADSSNRNWSPEAVLACKVFALDTLGVALSGSRVPAVRLLRELTDTWGRGQEARVIGTGECLTRQAAAFLNSYQIHNQEWDSVHEPAVVHPMAVVFATLLAWADAERGVSGQRFLSACCIAVDVACSIGAAARNKLRFFRPAMCGALGATAGLAQLAGLSHAATRSALGLCYSQLSGTMQAHVEGSAMLPMQISFNTRAALDALALAQRGIVGPLNFLEGPFGYFSLIDPDWDTSAFESLGQTAEITRLSHKPFPSGRATHGGVDGALTLRRQLRFAVEDIVELRVYAPPLVRQLVDRLATSDMTPSYARLCLPYVVATALITGDVGVEDFAPLQLMNESRLRLANRIKVLPDSNPAPNALTPQRVAVTLRDGRESSVDLAAVLGAPGKPLSQAQHLAKFRRAAQSGLRPLPLSKVDALIAAVDRLDELADVRELFNHLEF